MRFGLGYEPSMIVAIFLVPVFVYLVCKFWVFTQELPEDIDTMSAPAVSIIMNCLNCRKDLPDALKSVREQTFQDFEIIFWDNGSKDRSAEIAKRFGPQLRYFSGTETVPSEKQRNLAIKGGKRQLHCLSGL